MQVRDGGAPPARFLELVVVEKSEEGLQNEENGYCSAEDCVCGAGGFVELWGALDGVCLKGWGTEGMEVWEGEQREGKEGDVHSPSSSPTSHQARTRKTTQQD